MKTHKSSFAITKSKNNQDNIYVKFVDGYICEGKNYGIDKRGKSVYYVSELKSGMGLRNFTTLKEAKYYAEKEADGEVQEALAIKKNADRFMKAREILLNKKCEYIKNKDIEIIDKNTWYKIIVNNLDLMNE